MTQETCSRCGHSFSPASAPGGMCPHCLLLGGADETPGEALSVEELRDVVPGFRIETLLGRGGMGAVFRARQLDLDRDVAIKFIVAREHDPSFGERFEREARTMARLNHPNIVTAHSYGRTAEEAEGNREGGGRASRDGHAYIVMEYVAGGDLAQLIAAGNIPEAVALSLVEQVCSALAYAHEQGCVHRDIKPGNILIDLQGRVKVADFGLAKLLGENVPSSALTLSFVGVGTPLYAAPEQTKPGAPVDHRADIYALGVLLYEMLTGELPRGIFQNPSATSGTLRRWDGVIVRAMDARPERRFGTALDLGRELAVIRRELGFRTGVRRIGWKRPALVVAVIVAGSIALVPILQPSDFSIARRAHTLVLTDRSGRGGTLTVSEPEPGRIQFSAAERNFRVGWGWRTGGFADLPLAGVARIAIERKGGSSAIKFGAFTTPLPSLSLHGGTASIESSLAWAPGESLEIEAQSVRVVPGAKIVATGTGSIAVTARETIVLGRGASMETHDGNLTLLANEAGTAAGHFTGVLVDGALVQATGTGVVSVTGTGGDGGDSQFGVQVEHGGAIIGGTRGTTTVTGTGGRSRGENLGVRVSDRGSTIGSLGADVRVTGEGHGGLHVGEHARITAGGLGKVTVTGTGRDPAYGNYPVGVALTNNATIDSAGGDVRVTGTGGSAVGTDISGVFVQDSAISAGGKGAVAVQGRAGVPKPGSGEAIGVDVRWNSRITSAAGDISVDGTGASAGLRLTGEASRIVSGENHPITLRADSIRLDSRAVVSSGTAFLTIAPRTPGTAIDLGSTGGPTAGTLELSDAELSRITAGTLHVGDSGSGAVFVSIPLQPPASFVLTTGGTVRVDRPVTMKPGHNLTVTALNVYVTLRGAGLTASGTGAIAITASREVHMLHETSITTEDGNLTISANAGGSAIGEFHGVEILGGRIRTTGRGALSVAGTRGAGGDAVRFGVNLQEGGSISGGTGGTTVFADGNGARYALVVGTRSVGSITSDSPLLLRADSIELGHGATVSSGTAAMNITPRTAGAMIHLGSADVLGGSPPTLGLTDAELSRITAGTLNVGDSRSGGIAVTAPLTLATNLALTTGAQVSLENDVQLPPDKSLTVTALGKREKTVLPTSKSPAAATRERPFENTLGMRLVPVPITGGPTGGKRVLFSVWETRRQDYAPFAQETGKLWAQEQPKFEQGPAHPAVMVSWEAATEFAGWLTERERRSTRDRWADGSAPVVRAYRRGARAP